MLEPLYLQAQQFAVAKKPSPQISPRCIHMDITGTGRIRKVEGDYDARNVNKVYIRDTENRSKPFNKL